MLFAFSGCSTAGDIKESLEPREATLITGIDIQDHAVTITANKPFIYTIYRPIDPFKMTLELPDVSIGPFNNRLVSDKAGITELVPYQIKSPSLMAKLEILLQTPSLVEPEYKDNALKIKIKEEALAKEESGVRGQESGVLEEKEEASKTKEDIPEPAPVEQEPLPKATEISSIAFEGSAGLVKVLIKGNGSMTPNVFPLEGRIIIDVPEVVLNATLPSEVVSPVKGIRSGKHEDKVRLVLDLKEKTNFDVAAVGDSIVIALQGFEEKPSALSAAQRPEKAEAAEVKEPEVLVEGKYTGKKVSLDFQDADIAPIIRLLADMSGYNIVVSPEVKGKLTMKLINVPWDQALDLILKTFSLGKSIEGNIIRIAPYTVLAKESEEARKAEEEKKRALVELSPLKRETYHLAYANVENVKNQLLGIKLSSIVDQITKERTTEYTYDEKLRIVSNRGTATADRAVNVLVVTDIPDKIARVNDFIKEIDQPTQQVMIEAKIVSVSSDYSEALGIRWGGNFTQTWPNTTLSGDLSVNTPIATPGAHTINPGGALGLNIGTANTWHINLSLSALESVNKAKTLSNPKLLTLDTEKATISSGRTIYGRVPDEQGVPKLQKVEALLSLDVTPQIRLAPDGYYILLNVDVKDDSLVSADPLVISTKNIKTNALIKDGETLVLGGIYTTEIGESETGVPLLSRIPLLRWLFKTKTQSGPNVKEMLIFITPRVVTKS
jgi:type IV pilus secretin PilQ/predicted competence protein